MGRRTFPERIYELRQPPSTPGCLTVGLLAGKPVNMKKLRTAALLVMAISAINVASARDEQPHMARALEHLRAARTELERAEHNKGGWRARAIRNVEQAINDTENGMRAGHH